MVNILSYATDGPRVGCTSTSLLLSPQYVSAFFTVTMLSSLPRHTHHRHVLGMVAMDQHSTGMSLIEALLLRFMGVKGSPSGKWENSEVFKYAVKYF